MLTTFIYVLKDPRTGEIRYVGKANNPARRLQGHLLEAKKDGESHKNNWLRSLIGEGLAPVLELEDEIIMENWRPVEAAYIDFFKNSGHSLVNGTPGGDGLGTGIEHPFFGKRHSWGPKIAASKKGKLNSEAHKANVSAGMLGKKHSEERCLAKSIRQKGRKASEAHKAAMSAFWKGRPSLHKGRKHTPEARANMRAAMLLRYKLNPPLPWTTERRKKMQDAQERKRNLLCPTP